MWEGGESNWVEIIKLANVITFKRLCVYASQIETGIDQSKKHQNCIWSGRKSFSGMQRGEICGWVSEWWNLFCFPQRPERKIYAQVLMRELILKLCWKRTQAWYNTLCWMVSQAVGWCLLRTSTLHLPAFADKISFPTAFMQECGVVSALLHVICDLQSFCGAAEDLRQLSVLNFALVTSR